MSRRSGHQPRGDQGVASLAGISLQRLTFRRRRCDSALVIEFSCKRAARCSIWFGTHCRVLKISDTISPPSLLRVLPTASVWLGNTKLWKDPSLRELSHMLSSRIVQTATFEHSQRKRGSRRVHSNEKRHRLVNFTRGTLQNITRKLSTVIGRIKCLQC